MCCSYMASQIIAKCASTMEQAIEMGIDICFIVLPLHTTVSILETIIPMLGNLM